MLLGTDIQSVLTTLSALDVQVIGLNCSTGPEDMRDAIRYLGENSPVPVHCIPNAGPAAPGPRRRDDLPRGARAARQQPAASSSSATASAIVGGCCGTTPEHIARDRRARQGPQVGARPEPGEPLLSSMMTATPLAQDPAPTLVGERVNSQGSRKAKELLLADDYDGLVQIAEDQVEGGAHVLDLCVALTERTDEDEQMRMVAKRVSLIAARADPDRLDRARRDQAARSSRPRAARSSTRSTSRPAATSSTSSCRCAGRTAPR